MPGINSTNVKFLMARVENLYELSTLPIERLKVCMAHAQCPADFGVGKGTVTEIWHSPREYTII
jgi:hypothetical protein